MRSAAHACLAMRPAELRLSFTTASHTLLPFMVAPLALQVALGTEQPVWRYIDPDSRMQASRRCQQQQQQQQLLPAWEPARRCCRPRLPAGPPAGRPAGLCDS